MGILSGLKSLFSASDATPEQQKEDALEYKGFEIVPAPIKEGGQFRVAAIISKGQGENRKEHNFIRSDLIPSRDECIEITVRKTKLSIDQLGDNLFT